MEEWDEFLKGRYREGKSEEEFRQYDATANPVRCELLPAESRESELLAYVLSKESSISGLDKGEKSLWDAAAFLNTLVDDSDPDTDLTQIEHLLQTSEAQQQANPATGALVVLVSCMTWAKCFAYGANRSGEWSETRSRSGAPIPNTSYFLNTLPAIQTCIIPCIQQNTASMSQIAVSIRFICPSDTTAISTRR